MSSKPDSGKTTKAELMGDLVLAVVDIIKVDWVETSRLVVFQIFAFAQLERKVFPSARF